jgi:hypothetical protein
MITLSMSKGHPHPPLSPAYRQAGIKGEGNTWLGSKTLKKTPFGQEHTSKPKGCYVF